MAYCKHCGMESTDPAKCQWCGRPLSPAVSDPRSAPPPVRTTMDIVEEEEEKLRAGRISFLVAGSVLLIAASCVIAWRPHFFPWVIIGAAFLVGRMLVRNRVIEPFEDGWVLVGLLFVGVIFVPAFFVCLGYIAYGLICRNLDPTVVWLLGAYVVAVTVLEVVTILAFSQGVPLSAALQLYGVEKLSFLALAFGWTSG